MILVCYIQFIGAQVRVTHPTRPDRKSTQSRFMRKIFPSDILLVLGLAFFFAATAAKFSDKYMGTAINQSGYQIGRTK